ncbi:MAG: hypothetical protein J5I90_14170 [Caldilineales bacterium]|nr:hypothetical protein [Caldilineales bacterium]
MDFPPIEVPGNVYFGIFLVLLSIFCRLQAVKRGRGWVTANSFQKPSLDGRDAPMTLVFRGVTGGIGWLFFMALFLGFLFAGIDFILFDGKTTIGLLDQFTSMI